MPLASSGLPVGILLRPIQCFALAKETPIGYSKGDFVRD